MRVLLILDRPNLYGSEKHLLDLAIYLNSKDQVLVLVFDEGKLLDLFDTNNIRFCIQKVSWVPNPKVICTVIKIIKTFKPDLIHNHQPKATLYGSLLGWVLGVPSVNTIHSHAKDHAYIKTNRISKLTTYGFHLIVQFFSEALGKRNIFVSENSRDKSFFKKKSVVIYNWLKSYPSSIVKKPVLNGRRIKLLSVGSVTLSKGYDILLLFLEEIRDIDFEMYVLGDGDEGLINELKTKANHLNLNISFLGYQDYTDPYYRDSDFFVLFSRSETFGLSFLEAASYGLPILGLELPVLNEILPVGNLLSNDIKGLASEFRILFQNQKLYDKISLLNQKWAKDAFSFSVSIKKLEGVYSSILSINIV
jgi:glycosyltransferase involved in cell wall biosynthesis